MPHESTVPDVFIAEIPEMEHGARLFLLRLRCARRSIEDGQTRLALQYLLSLERLIIAGARSLREPNPNIKKELPDA